MNWCGSSSVIDSTYYSYDDDDDDDDDDDTSIRLYTLRSAVKTKKHVEIMGQTKKLIYHLKKINHVMWICK